MIVIGMSAKKLSLAALIAAVLAVAGGSALAVWALSRSENTESTSGVRQTGGGHEPSPALLDVYTSLPLPAVATVDQEPVATGDDDLTAVFWVKEAPEAIAAFYSSELIKEGWTPEFVQRVATDKKDDGTQGEITELVFVKEDKRLIVGIAPNLKYPPLGQAHMALTIQSR